VLVPRYAPDVVVEGDVAFEIDVLDIRSVVGEAMKARRPVVEDDVVLQQQRAGLTLTVDPVTQIVGASVVVDNGPVDFGRDCLRPDENAVIGRVMDDQVDDLDSGPFEVDAVHNALLRSGVRDLKTPKPRV